MKIRKITACVLAAVATAAAVAPASSRAETPDEWQYSATIYAWLPDIGGSTKFPEGGGGSSVEVTASDILDALNFAFMGAFNAQKGRWGIFTDVNYLDLSNSAKQSRDLTVGGQDLPVGVTAKADLGITGWLWTTEGSYRVVDKPDYHDGPVAGVRMLNLADGPEVEPDRRPRRSADHRPEGQEQRQRQHTGTASSASRAVPRSATTTSGSCRTTSTSAPATAT